MWTLRLILFTPFAMLISIITAGGGHGTPIPTLLCYPIFFLLDVFKSGGGPFVWIMLVGQFPIYGLIIDFGNRISRAMLVTGAVIVIHIALVLLAAMTLD